MIDLHSERRPINFYVGNPWWAYGSSLVLLGIALAVYLSAGHFLSYAPTDPELIQKVHTLKLWAIPFLLLASFPIVFTLSLIRIDDGGVAFRRLIRWKHYTWSQLQRAELCYCESCRCLRIDCDGRSRKYALSLHSDDDRHRLFDQLSLGGVIAGPLEQAAVLALHPWWSGTSYEFGDEGITVDTNDERRLIPWEHIPSGCIERISEDRSTPHSISIELDGETIQLCRGCCNPRGRTACLCSILKPVTELMQRHMSDDRLTVAVRKRSLSEIETEEELDRYEKHHQAGFWELRACVRVVGGFIAVVMSIVVVAGIVQLWPIDAEEILRLAMIASGGYLMAAFLAFGIPRYFESGLIKPIRERRKELAEAECPQAESEEQHVRLEAGSINSSVN